MNEAERIILENQSSIMFALSKLVSEIGCRGTSTNLNYRRDMTKRYLNSDDANCVKTEQKIKNA